MVNLFNQVNQDQIDKGLFKFKMDLNLFVLQVQLKAVNQIHYVAPKKEPYFSWLICQLQLFACFIFQISRFKFVLIYGYQKHTKTRGFFKRGIIDQTLFLFYSYFIFSEIRFGFGRSCKSVFQKKKNRKLQKCVLKKEKQKIYDFGRRVAIMK
eukprot:TRINITY_DN10450_c0_g1_i3.p3 TRINITY_DN10450_c0_g1~~TRINITY_DN10450_c0_g1_i3.p3  ORF type:complete len:153 (+),score=4.98 TRINITY_DN10450_c0_g1_i3:1124-1582(+)